MARCREEKKSAPPFVAWNQYHAHCRSRYLAMQICKNILLEFSSSLPSRNVLRAVNLSSSIETYIITKTHYVL